MITMHELGAALGAADGAECAARRRPDGVPVTAALPAVSADDTVPLGAGPVGPPWAGSGASTVDNFGTLPGDLAAALRSLPPRTRAVADAAYLGGVGARPAELAAMFGVSDRTIRNDLAAARAAVAGVLGVDVPCAAPLLPDSSWLALATLEEVEEGFTGGRNDRDTAYSARSYVDVSRRWVEQHCPEVSESFEPLLITGTQPTRRRWGHEEFAEWDSARRFFGGGAPEVAAGVESGTRSAPVLPDRRR